MLRTRKNLKDKLEELKRMGAEKILILEHMTRDYGKMDFACRALKWQGVIEETWFFNGRLFFKRSKNDKRTQISHMEDIYNIFGRECVDNLFKKTLY